MNLPIQGDWRITVSAVDTSGQVDPSTSGATSRYPIYPGDQPPVLNEGLLNPIEGTEFPDGKIFVSGRAEDDQAMQEVEVGIVNAAGQYMSSSGTFTSTNASWRTAFLNSPGTPGSNFSYTTPVIPPGAYTVRVRAIDQHDFVSVIYERHVTVTQPPNNPPVASFTTSCVENNCTFDARGSTDENAPTLTYSWNFGNGSGSGPVPTRRYTSANTYTVTLTARDEWGATATATTTVTIVEPTGNQPPNAGDQPARVLQPVVQLLGGRLRRPQHRRHVQLPLELGRRDGRQHVDVAVAHVPGRGHLHGDADGHGRLGQGDLVTRNVTVPAP